MNPSDINNLIGSIGFPIAACTALFWMINTTMKELTSVIQELSNSIQDVIRMTNESDKREVKE